MAVTESGCADGGVIFMPPPVKAPALSPEAKILAAFERVQSSVRTRLWASGQRNRLTPLQAQVLVLLAEHTAANTVSEAAARCGVTKATMSACVQALERKSLLHRLPDTVDNRRAKLALTPSGVVAAQQLQSEMRVFSDILAGIGEPACAQLWQNMVTVLRRMEQNGLVPRQGMCFSCAHFIGGAGDAPDHCRLLGQPLKPTDIQLDCPEHRLQDSAHA